MDALFQNIRVGIRSLRRTPGVALLAVLTLALGIGLSTAVFTVADALLLRRLPVRDQDRLIVLSGAAPDRAFDYPVGFSDGGEFIRSSRTLEQAALFLYNGAGPVPVRDGDRIARLRRALVSGEFFQVLGARAALGRALRPADDVRGAAPVAVLSHAVWQGRFNGDPRVLGRQIVLYSGGRPYTIVGVMPQGLDYPRGTDFWAPVTPSMSPETLSLMAFYVIGRLGPGATPANAADELTAFFRRAEDSWQREQHGVATRLAAARAGRRAARADRLRRRHGPDPADHVHQRRQSSPGARPRPGPGGRGSVGARREPRADRVAVVGRELAVGRRRRRARCRGRGRRRPGLRRIRATRFSPARRDSCERDCADRCGRHHRRRDDRLRARPGSPDVPGGPAAGPSLRHSPERRPPAPAGDRGVGGGTARGRPARPFRGRHHHPESR